MKICKFCQKTKEFSEFYKNGHTKDKVDIYCKGCAKQKAREREKLNPDRKRNENRLWRKNNPEKSKAFTQKWQKNNPDKVKARAKRWRDNNPEKVREGNRKSWIKNKANRKRNPIYKIASNLRNRIKDVLNGKIKSGSAINDMGCSLEQLKSHFEQFFEKQAPNKDTKQLMSWDNYGKTGWHIDHIKPLSSFNLTNKEEFLKACHYTNLQPLWWYDNLSKSDKI